MQARGTAGIGAAAIACLLLAGCDRPAGNTQSIDTTLKEPAPARLKGELSYPSDYIPNDMRVCAEDVEGGEARCDAQFSGQGGRRTYELAVPAGRYRVYATTRAMPNYRAYYSEAVTCGLQAGCTSHEPIVVEVRDGETREGVNPQDWYADTAPALQRSEEQVVAITRETASTWTPEERALISRWHELNTRCRGGSGDVPATHAACEERDGPAARELGEAEICYGREGESGYQMEMHRCGPTSLR